MYINEGFVKVITVIKMFHNRSSPPCVEEAPGSDSGAVFPAQH